MAWRNILVQYGVFERQTETLIGIVIAYEPRLRSGTVKLALMVDPAYPSVGHGIAAAALFMDFLFARWPVRCIYFEALEENSPQFGAFISHVGQNVVELQGYQVSEGKSQCLKVAIVTREEWDRVAAGIIAEGCEVHSRKDTASGGSKDVCLPETRSLPWCGRGSVAFDSRLGGVGASSAERSFRGDCCGGWFRLRCGTR